MSKPVFPPFRKSGRAVTKPGKTLAAKFTKIDPAWKQAKPFPPVYYDRARATTYLFKPGCPPKPAKGEAYKAPDDFKIADAAAQALPLARNSPIALFTELDKGNPFPLARCGKRFMSRWQMIYNPQNLDAINAFRPCLNAGKRHRPLARDRNNYAAIMDAVNKNWSEPVIWETVKLHSPVYTGYF